MKYPDYIHLSDRVLIALNPAFEFGARHFPARFKPPETKVPHPSAMLYDHDWLYRAIFPRFFERISIDDTAVSELKSAAAKSTIVYVTKTIGQLEYHYFNHLFLKEKLPLAEYSNAMTLRRWMKWDAMRASIKQQENEISQFDEPIDPLTDGGLKIMIAEGKSVLISIQSSDLSEEGLFLTGPMKLLCQIIEAQRKSARPISIVPLDFLWSRRPEKTAKSVLDILFGEKESPGALRKTVLFWRNYKKDAQAIIGEPIDLSTFVLWEGGDDKRLAMRLRGALMSALKTQRRTITGPPIRPHRWFMQEIEGDESLDKRICRIAAEMEKPVDDLREMAGRYAREIIADVNHTYIELLDRVLTPVFGRTYESVNVDDEGLKKAKELYSQGPVVFVPNHKSHMDYLILSHIFYHRGMTLPFIAAGINLEFWPLGKIFRRCGAFFIRRAFRGNELYRAVLETYLKVLLKEGYSQEFFIEGGRSRTGKLSKPRTGMLSMLHEAAIEAKIPNLHFIPVSITYDRVIEQKSYVKELEGGAKEKEGKRHILSLARYLRRQKQRYGSVYVRFGEPVSAAKESGSDAIECIAQKICRQINRNIVVTPAAAAAFALLASAKRGVAISEIKRGWDMLLSYLEAKGVSISGRIRSGPDAAFHDALSLLSQAKLVEAHRVALDPFFSIDEKRRVPLSLFKNGIVHFLVTVGVVSRLIRKTSGPIAASDISDDFESCRRLLAYEFKFAEKNNFSDHIRTAVDFLISRGALCQIDDTKFKFSTEGLWILDLFYSSIGAFVETLWIAFRHVTEKMTGDEDEKLLVSEMMKTGEELFLLEKVKSREAITKPCLENALRALVSYDILNLQTSIVGGKTRKTYSRSQNKAAIGTLKAQLERLF